MRRKSRLKKFFILTLTLLLTLNSCLVNANKMDDAMEQMGHLGVIQVSDYHYFGGVTRYQVIKSITTAMGLTNIMAINVNSLLNPNLNPYGIERPLEEFVYYDFEVAENSQNYIELFTQEITKDELEESFWYLKYTSKEMGAVTAAFYNDITRGVIIDGKRYFLFEQEATLNEVLAFMTRCLKGTDTDVSNIYDTAVEIGLIDPEGHFDKIALQNVNSVSIGYFSILMERFVNQNRYMYFDFDSPDFPKTSIDETGQMTYKQYLTQILFDHYSLFNEEVLFTPEMVVKVADIVFNSKFGESFVKENSYLTINDLKTMYKISRKPSATSENEGKTVYISKYNGSVIDLSE